MALDPLPEEHAEEVLALEGTAWLRLQRIFRKAKTTMVERLNNLIDTGHGETIRAQHAAAIAFEVGLVLKEATPELLASLGKSTGEAIEMGTSQALAEVAGLETRFGLPTLGEAIAASRPSLPIDAILRISDPQLALLTKFGEGITEAAAESLGLSLTLGEGIRPAAKRLGLEIEAEAWKLERIARTEINHSVNAAHLATLIETATAFPDVDLWKQWSAEVLDGRCCKCCEELDGQVQKLDDDFIAPDGWTGPGPCKHPNCRCRCNPWSPRWTEGKQPKYVTAAAALEADMEFNQRRAATFTLRAMALDVPAANGAPNRHPFKGVLCQLDTPSTRAPEGSGGDRVILPTSVAEAILPSLLGQGVNFRDDLAGHDVQTKVGVITAATIADGAIHVEGIIYDQDFPLVVPAIQAANATAGDEVGMSFELGVNLVSEGAGVSRIKSSNGFTGAAILRCRDAAYHDTHLAASAAKGATKMTPEEFAALLATNNAALMVGVRAEISSAIHAASRKKGKAGFHEDIDRAHSLHSDLCKAMSGYDNKDAALHAGALSEHLASMKAGADDYQEEEASAVKGAAATTAAAPTVDPAIATQLTELAATLKAQADEIKSLTVRAAGAAKEPERVTISPAIAALLAKADMTPKEGDAPPTAAIVTAALDKAGIPDSVTRLEALARVPN